MTAREAMIERVRQAAQQGRKYRFHLQSVPDDIGYLGAGDDLVGRFAAELIAVGGQAHIVHSTVEAREKLQSLLQEIGAVSAVCWQHELLDRLDVRGLLSADGVTACDYSSLAELSEDECRTRLLACEVGLTSCGFAIAETGTLVMCSHPGRERVASLLPPVHIALMEQRQVLPDLIDVFQSIETANLPSNVTFITGPSKTGDIELQLTTGVHGPGRLEVIVITSQP